MGSLQKILIDLRLRLYVYLYDMDEQTYDKVPRSPVSLKQTKCRLQFVGHYQQAKGEIIQSLFLWKPSGLVCSRKLTFPDMMLRDFFN